MRCGLWSGASNSTVASGIRRVLPCRKVRSLPSASGPSSIKLLTSATWSEISTISSPSKTPGFILRPRSLYVTSLMHSPALSLRRSYVLEIPHSAGLLAAKQTNRFPSSSSSEKIMNRLLSADPARIGRPDVPPSSDAVDEERVEGTSDELKNDLTGILGEDLVRHRISDLVRYASDASPYRYIPKAVVQPKVIDHVAAIFQYCIREG